MAPESDRSAPTMEPPPRLVTRHQAAAYCNLSPGGFSSLVRTGKLPPPLPGTTRWDLKAIDAALDPMSGLQPQKQLSALDEWRAKRARRTEGIHKVKRRLANGEPPGDVPLSKVESDPNGIAAKTPGAKLDAGKSPVFRGAISYFPRALMAVADVSQYGANKYSWKGWESVPDGINRYSDALGRHIAKEGVEGLYDLEIRNDPKFPGEILHASQVAWNALARLELLLRQISSSK